MQEFTCSKCGGSLVKNGDLYQCAYCHTDFKADNLEKEKKALAELLDEQKQEKLSNLRRLLWTEIHEEYIDSEKIVELCSSIQKISPDDFEAKFFTLANGGSEAQINAFLRGVDFSDSAQAVWAEEMIRFMLKSLRAKNLLAVQNLIERAFKNTDLAKYEKYSTVFSREAERVSRGVYEPSLPRDVFVMYSSKDMQTVESLVETLEERGLACFVAARNLQHGRGATANYQQALETAMSACKTIVFVSSKYSRSMSCDAVRVEIPYFMAKDKENSPFEFRQRYDKMPAQYKKSRVEYRLDNESSAENSIVKEFFGGLEYAYSKEEVAKRIETYLTQEIAVSEEPKTSDEPNQKYQELLEQYNRLQEQVKKDEPVSQTKERALTANVTGEFRRDGEYAYFGMYPQSEGTPKTIGEVDSNGYFDGGDGYRYAKEGDKYFKVEPIKWRILSEEKGKLLLLSEKVLDAGPSEKDIYTARSYYNDSIVRSFLNVKFLKKAFIEKEKSKIILVQLKNDCGHLGEDKERQTKDKIFLLSKEELMNQNYGFLSVDTADKDRVKTKTDYTLEKCGIGEICLTRSTEVTDNIARTRLYSSPVYVDGKGCFVYDGFDGNEIDKRVGKRTIKNPYGYVPALWIKTKDWTEEEPETKNEPPVVEKKAETKEVSTKQELTKGVIRDGKYLWFGEYPQTKKPANVTVYDGLDEDGYSRASDGCRYGKAKDGKHYKVEPIKWRILYEDGKKLKLLADKILDFSNGSYINSILGEMFKKLEKSASSLQVKVKTCECLGLEETKERLSRFKRIRKSTAFAQNNTSIKKESKKVEMEGVNYWWADYKYIVTPFGSVQGRKELYSNFYGHRDYAGTCWYGVVPCITIEILD